ncbi:hypothetical protein COCON_G00018750 [Conger conger]|uniref:Uncharacterized protein n=1 Tax=Conger conger TaxID=82655 RepID=A0A9Q1I9V5_CONCO|nr:hypothetical protein COCON_G00018750 [Conger conger]
MRSVKMSEDNYYLKITETNGEASLFEVNIRYVGGLLSAYYLTGAERDGAQLERRVLRGGRAAGVRQGHSQWDTSSPASLVPEHKMVVLERAVWWSALSK